MNKLLTPEDVRTKTFHTRHLREGYDVNEVDDFLDEVQVTVNRLANTIKELEKEEVK